MKTHKESISKFVHDIRNPLGGIKGFGELLKSDLSSDPKSQSFVVKILSATSTIDALITEFHHSSHFHISESEEIDLTAFLIEMKDALYQNQDLSGTKIIIPKNEVPMNTYFERQSVRQTLCHLILPLIKSMKSHGTITISIEKDADHAVLKISEGGTEKTEQEIKELFFPFLSLRSTNGKLVLMNPYVAEQSSDNAIRIETDLENKQFFSIKLPLSKES